MKQFYRDFVPKNKEEWGVALLGTIGVFVLIVILLGIAVA